MNTIIAEILKGFITPLNFAETVGGLVKAIDVTQLDEDITKVPADYSLSQHQVSKNNYKKYVPDASKRSVIYFEDGGNSIVNHTSRYINLTSTLKLVAWFNLSRINTDLNNASTLMILLMNAIPKSFPNQSNILKARIEFAGQDPKTSDIFAPYDYDEAELQHLMHPYDFGALNYNIIFSVKPDCLDQITLKLEDCLSTPKCL